MSCIRANRSTHVARDSGNAHREISPPGGSAQDKEDLMGRLRDLGYM